MKLATELEIPRIGAAANRPSPYPRILFGAETGIMGDVAPSGTQQTLVGRDRELGELCSLLGIRSAAAAPRPEAHVALLVGDAGVGKTRLLTELRDRSFAEGWQVLAGHCVDFGDSALPYLPFSEVIGRLVKDLPDVVERVADIHPGLRRLQPGRRVLSEEDGDRTSVDRAELFTAVHALLGAAAEVAPLLMVIEDAHWADSSTRDLISFLCSRPHEQPVAIVVSYRGEDLHRRHPLRAKVAEWSRMHGVARVQLNPLDEESVRQLVHELHPRPLTETEIAGIVGRADGNAFFVEELVGAASSSTRRGVPDDLADLLLVRLDRLDDTARQVVRTMSAAGRRVSHTLLAAASGVPTDALETALRAAVESHIVVAAGTDSYAFRHALLAEAIYDDLLPGERVRLHAAYVEALRSGVVPGTAAGLARHARAALDLPTALSASIRAGDEAMAVGGPDEAAHHFEHALEIAVDPKHAGDLDVSDLVLKTADALVDSGTPARAQALLERHLALVDDTVTDATRARLHLIVAFTSMLTDNDTDWRSHIRAAEPLIPTEVSRERAKLLALAARTYALGKLPEAHEAATEALAMAETLNLPKTASDATTTLVGLNRDVPITELAAALEDSARRAAKTGAMGAELRALFLLGRAWMDRGGFVEAGSAFARATTRARGFGIPWAPYAFDARLQHAQTAYLAGDWDLALELTDVGGQSPPLLAEAMLVAWQAAVLSARGEPQRDRLRRLHGFWHKDGMVAISGVPIEIEELGRAGRIRDALDVERLAVEVVSASWGELFQARVRIDAVTIGSLAACVPTMSADERSAYAAEADRLFADGSRVVEHHTEGRQWGLEGRAWSKRLEAETLRMRWLTGIDAPPLEDLIAVWQDAVSFFSDFGHRYETAVSELRLAEVLRASGDVTGARGVATSARATAKALGAAVLLDDLKKLGSAAVRPEAPAVALTPRESEILQLVAEGRSNGEIGKQLFISAKTVSVHVSNILAKLGAAGRTEAAAIARRKGLLA